LVPSPTGNSYLSDSAAQRRSDHPDSSLVAVVGVNESSFDIERMDSDLWDGTTAAIITDYLAINYLRSVILGVVGMGSEKAQKYTHSTPRY
jgi:hypothetical protein